MIIAKILHYLLWRNNRRLQTKQTLIISVTAVKIAYTFKILQLLPGKHTVCLIMELVGNRSSTPTTSNDKWSSLRRLKNGVPQGFLAPPCFSHLHLWSTNHCLQKVCIRHWLNNHAC